MSSREERYQQQKINAEINRAHMWELKQQPCTDCGLRYHPHVMTFDHRDRKALKYTKAGKIIGINATTYWNPEIFNKQLEMMDVVCKNCHSIREAKRDINDPKIRPAMKHLFPIWFDQCKGALVKGQVKE